MKSEKPKKLTTQKTKNVKNTQSLPSQYLTNVKMYSLVDVRNALLLGLYKGCYTSMYCNDVNKPFEAGYLLDVIYMQHNTDEKLRELGTVSLPMFLMKLAELLSKKP